MIRAFGYSISAVALLLSLAACDQSKNYLKQDRATGYSAQDYRDAFAARDANEKSTSEKTQINNQIPKLQSYLNQDSSENTKPMPLVSISVNQEVPLKDVLFELARQADYDLELDSNITGSIIFTARNKPFDEVIERISESAGLKYSFENEVLHIALDLPTQKVYKIEYLSFIRKTSSSIQNNVSVVTGGGADAGSSYGITSETENDFWGDLESGLSQILNVQAAYNTLRSQKTPKLNVSSKEAPVETLDENGNPVVEDKDQPTLTVDSLPVEDVVQDAAADPNAAAAGGAAGGAQAVNFSINKQAGLVTIFANSRQHALAQQYLDMVKKAVSSQVLIEAKVLEVNLSDQFSTGINWQSLSSAVGWDVAFSGAQGLARPAIPDSFGGFSLGYVRNTGANAETSLVEALSRFGTVKALASPRLTVLNNQAASLVVAKNQVFFNVDVDVQPGTSTSAPLTSVSSEIQSVPVGVLINVFPSIDVARDEVTMSVRPTITKIDDFVVDPGSAYAAALAGQQNPNLNTSDLVSQVPVTNVQEIDSIVQMKSGQAVLMGGLIQDNAESTTNGVPVLSELPGVGALFRNQVDSVSKTELVIMLKATIISSGGETIHDTDKEFYKAFAQDRRPFNLDGNK